MRTLYIIAGPTGVGKTSVTEMLEKDSQAPRAKVVITCTSRPMRAYEQDGVHFHFMKREKLQSLADSGQLFEFAENHGNLYGTPWSFLAGSSDKVIIFDIAAAVRARVKLAAQGERAVIIFIEPGRGAYDIVPRLKQRGESDDRIKVRLQSATKEVSQRMDADYIVPSEDGNLMGLYRDVRGIIRSDQLRVENYSSALTHPSLQGEYASAVERSLDQGLLG